jgi:hypothetical protein
MTEAEWLACSDPERMLAFLGSKASDRIRRLFACACCRRVWHLLADERSREAIGVAEEFAAGRATLAELTAARGLAHQVQTDAKHAEWCAEAEANFCYTADYCAVCARLCAACAARAALSVVVAEPDGGWECYQPVDSDLEEVRLDKLRHGSHSWVASAIGEEKRSAVYSAREVEKPALHDMADLAGSEASAAEAAEQAVVLRALVGNPYRDE